MAANLPIVLSTGQVAIYGLGGQGVTQDGIVISDDQRYGTVYHIWSGGETYIYGNNRIIFFEKDVVCRVVTAGLAPNTYTVIPARLVTNTTIPDISV